MQKRDRRGGLVPSEGQRGPGRVVTLRTPGPEGRLEEEGDRRAEGQGRGCGVQAEGAVVWQERTGYREKQERVKGMTLGGWGCWIWNRNGGAASNKRRETSSSEPIGREDGRFRSGSRLEQTLLSPQ